MTYRNSKYRYCLIALLSCFMWVAGIDVFAQTTVAPVRTDSLSVRPAPKARARRNRPADLPARADSIGGAAVAGVNADSVKIAPDSLASKALADSIAAENNRKIKEMESAVKPVMAADSLPAKAMEKKIWIPNSAKATWLAVVFPGAGQIYNRKFWKLPIVYGGFAGCAYALSWNGKMYKDYSQAYLDIMDDDPSTKSYEDIFGTNSRYSETQMKDLLKSRKDRFRRYRDLSIFATIGVYLISIVDAYVDAELSNFDITPDLSMRIEPTVINTKNYTSNNGYNRSVGLQCSLRF